MGKFDWILLPAECHVLECASHSMPSEAVSYHELRKHALEGRINKSACAPRISQLPGA